MAQTEGQTSLRGENCHRLPAAEKTPSLLNWLTLPRKDGGNERPQCHPGNERPQCHSSGKERPPCLAGNERPRGPRCCGIEEQKRGINIPALRPTWPQQGNQITTLTIPNCITVHNLI